MHCWARLEQIRYNTGIDDCLLCPKHKPHVKTKNRDLPLSTKERNSIILVLQTHKKRPLKYLIILQYQPGYGELDVSTSAQTTLKILKGK